MNVKYPRTPYLPWSPDVGGRTDRVLRDVDHLVDREIVITEKLDGGNLTMTGEEVFARSHMAAPAHRSFDLAKASHAYLRYQIPPGLSVFFEYMFAVHTIVYECLPSYLFTIGVRDDQSRYWWNWDETEQMAATLNVPTVPVLFRGIVRSPQELADLTDTLGSQPSVFGPDREGVVVRVASEFKYLGDSLAKWVRPGHVAGEHWTRGQWFQQRLC
jgi:hypothetical protein